MRFRWHLQWFPVSIEEMLRPEYLKTAAESADGLDIPYMAGDSILYVPMETFEQLLGEEPEKTICLEISLTGMWRRQGRSGGRI